MTPKTYHIGLCRGIDTGLWANGHRADTVIMQVVRDLDYLSPQTWHYLGERQTTKARLRNIKAQLLAHINATYAAQIRNGPKERDRTFYFRHIIIE